MLTIPQVAEELGMTRANVWKYVHANRLTAERYGKYFLIDREDLNAFLAERNPHRQKPGPKPRRPRPA